VYFPNDPEFKSARKRITPEMAESLRCLRADFKYLKILDTE